MITRKVKFKRKIVATSRHVYKGETVPFRRTCERGKIYELPEHAAMYQIRKGNADLSDSEEISQVKEEYQKDGKWHLIKK